MDVMYTIVKFYITKLNDVIIHHSMAVVSNQSDCIIKKSTFRNERDARKRIYHGVRDI